MLRSDAGGRTVASFRHVPKRSWEDWWDANRDRFDERSIRVVAAASSVAATSGSGSCLPDDVWSFDLTPIPSSRRPAVTLWTGDRMIIFGNSLQGGNLYDPLTDSWALMPREGLPVYSYYTAGVWTGSEMIVWGGSETVDAYDTSKASGGIYDPPFDSWTPTSEVNAPQARMLHWAFWTGDRMLVWGGTPDICTDLGSGGLYDPVMDTWTATTSTGGAAPRDLMSGTAVWTGTQMIVWGGRHCVPTGPSSCSWTAVSGGGRYDPYHDRWTPMSTVDEAAPRYYHHALWTGQEMLVYGGNPYTGGRYALGGGTDNDGDGFSECDGDCNDGNPGVWAPPLPVDVDYELVTGGVRLSWDPQYVSSGTSTTYDIFTGSGDALPSTGGDFSGGTCAAVNLTTSWYTDTTPNPPLGGIRYFILRAQNACGSGTYGDANRDATAAAGSNPCP